MKSQPKIERVERVENASFVRDLGALLLQKPIGEWGKRGPTHKPTNETIRFVLCTRAHGMSGVHIAQALGINERTLQKHYAHELEIASALVKAHIGNVIVEAALSGNIPAAKYFLSTHYEEWRVNAAAAQALFDDRHENDEVVHFYLPENGRDQPEERIDPLEIDGEAEEAA